jgi:hypothetical protein
MDDDPAESEEQDLHEDDWRCQRTMGGISGEWTVGPP